MQKVTYKNVHNKFKLNGKYYSKNEINRVAVGFIKEGEAYEKNIFCFLLNWFDSKPYIDVKTSGTTGNPKVIQIEKQAMVESALATGDFFQLHTGDKALLCLSTNYIAGKMMLVRAIILGLEIDTVDPSSNPLKNNLKQYDFVAMVPLQVEQSLKYLNNVKKLIIGGAALHTNLRNKLVAIDSEIYETYGMTETITHIAAKKIDEENFNALPDVVFSVNSNNCLQISAPRVSKKLIITNDIVDLVSNNSFRLLGRFDNVINSGGVKLFPEIIENKLQDKISHRFFISSIEDVKLGEVVVLVIEANDNIELQKEAFEHLEKYETPKKIFYINKFIETETGKINRKETFKIIKVV